MELDVKKVSATDWAEISEVAHQIVFARVKPASHDRISYALLVTRADAPVLYVTVREETHERVYWQFGGAFPTGRHSLVAWRAFQAIIRWQQARSSYITMLVENRNAAMLKGAIKAGFLVTGVKSYKRTILVELSLETKNGDRP